MLRATDGVTGSHKLAETACTSPLPVLVHRIRRLLTGNTKRY